MQKNWYMLYMKPRCEKKVSSLLTRKKIENFCPQTKREVAHFRKSKTVSELLFESYIFVKVEPSMVNDLLQLENVINIVHWKNKPAIIADQEIEIMKKIIRDHTNIIVKKTKVAPQEIAMVLDKPSYSIDGNLVSVRSNPIRVNLPSIGFTLTISADSTPSIYSNFIQNRELLFQ